jgi:hypothetical protein
MRKEVRKVQKLKQEQAMETGAPNMVINLEFLHLMTTSQLSKLMQHVKKERNPIFLQSLLLQVINFQNFKLLFYPQSRSRACDA